MRGKTSERPNRSTDNGHMVNRVECSVVCVWWSKWVCEWRSKWVCEWRSKWVCEWHPIVTEKLSFQKLQARSWLPSSLNVWIYDLLLIHLKYIWSIFSQRIRKYDYFFIFLWLFHKTVKPIFFCSPGICTLLNTQFSFGKH